MYSGIFNVLGVAHAIPNEASMKFIPLSCRVLLVPQRLEASAVCRMCF